MILMAKDVTATRGVAQAAQETGAPEVVQLAVRREALLIVVKEALVTVANNEAADRLHSSSQP